MASLHTTLPMNNGPASASGSGNTTPPKRHRALDEVAPLKRLKSAMLEEPQVYSDAVRKKLAATSRTGQACDRCKERKMKCDTDPTACQPCRQKNLRCYTTDRVTGQSRERGQSNRTENELQFLREQNAAYRRKFGPLQAQEAEELANVDRGGPMTNHLPEPEGWSGSLPSSKFIGWPAPDFADPLRHGPVHGTQVDVLDGIIDIADFECELMKDYSPGQLNVYNVSRTSISNTTTGYQTITDPRLPTKDEAIQTATTFLLILNQYAPILHRPSFTATVNRIYDQPQSATLAERVQLAIVLAIVSFQTAVRNHSEAAEKFEQSHYWLHYGLTWYRELIRERSLASMQALALILVHLRNMPKPGYSWAFGHNILMKAIELEYHRDPDNISLPPIEDNPLGKEMRKRVFHSILGICITTGCRVSKPAPWQFQHMDVPLPRPIQDFELSENGIGAPTGKCDFWPCLQLAKLLPLLTEAYNYVTVVRRTEAEYVKIVEALHTKIDAWRQDWDTCIEDDESHVNLKVATLLMESWAAEYLLNLYHPSLCPDRAPEVMEKHLDICHKQAQRLLKSFHILSQRYKGVDFTWHSAGAYAMAFGITLYIYNRRKARATHELYEVMRNELKGWMSLMAYADLVMRTRNHLQHIFEPRVSRLEADYLELLKRPSFTPPARQQTPSSSANGSSVIKLEPSQARGSSSLSSGASTTSYSTIPSQQDLSQAYNTTPVSSTPSWQHIPFPPSSGSATMAGYNPNLTGYGTMSTSLAPLLNNSASTAGPYPATSTVPNEVMMYAPNHYTDTAAGSSGWPLISLPPNTFDDTTSTTNNNNHNHKP